MSQPDCTDWRYYCTQAAPCLPAPVHSLAGENNHATTSDPAGCPETGALGGLNPLAMLGASREGKGPLICLPAERGWRQLPAKRGQQTAGKAIAHSTCRAGV